mmetsp:Transcript_2552/g.7626  ORF Transcript_2552/g.7626 Transcript_2552/m.7626 type:complete len:663 (-) Transcript_2552:143-2131(-)
MRVKDYISHLDGLRALALTGVLAFHFNVSGFGGGFAGVDSFLVLSGFLMTRNILFTLLGAYVLYSPELAVEVARSARAALGIHSNVYFLQHSGYFDVESSAQPLLHSWSLSLEEQFYLVWPMLLLAMCSLWQRGARRRHWSAVDQQKKGQGPESNDEDRSLCGVDNDHDDAHSKLEGGKVVLKPAGTGAHQSVPWLLVTFALVAMSVASVGFAHIMGSRHAEFCFFMLPARIYEFGAGGLAAMLWPHRPTSRWVNEIVNIAGLVTIAATFYALPPHASVFWSFPVVVGTAAVISTPGALASRMFLSNALVRFLGRLTYAAYLTHWPVWVYASQTAHLLAQRDSVGPGFVVVVALTLVTALALRHLVEDPVRSGRRKMLGPVLLVVACTVALSAWCLRTEGNQNIARGCLLGKPEAKNLSDVHVLVLGDSFTRHLAPALDKLGREHGYSFLIQYYGGCPIKPISQGDLEKAALDDTTCEDFVRARWDLLNKFPKDRPVLLANRWFQRDFPSLHSLNRLADMVSALKMRPILVASPPGIAEPKSYYLCHSSMTTTSWLLEHFGAPQTCSNYASPLTETEIMYKLFSEPPAEERRFSYLSFRGDLCEQRPRVPGTACRTLTDDLPGSDVASSYLYASDGIHFSFNGSRALSSILYEELRALDVIG